MTPDAAAALADAGRQLADAGVPALVLSEPQGLPHVELLLPRGQAQAAERALDRSGWRWRAGGDGGARVAGLRRYTFDDGLIFTVHRTLPTWPLPPPLLRPLERALWAHATEDVSGGLRRPRPEAQLVYLGLQVARGTLRSRSALDELRSVADQIVDWDAAWSLAGAVGVRRTLERTLATPAPAKSRPRPTALPWLALRTLRGLRRTRTVADLLAGEPWKWAVTRCRFDVLELLAGPGVFLPRGVSEPLVAAAQRCLGAAEHPLLVDIGTGCGAVALALARRHPDARVLGVDVDAEAISWARRNAHRSGATRADFAVGSLIDPVPASWRGQISLVVGNLPCVPPDAYEGSFDAPSQAYVGADADGLGLHRRLAEQAREVLRPGGWLVVQLAPARWDSFRHAVERLGFEQLEARGDDVAIAAAARWPGSSRAQSGSAASDSERSSS